MSANRFGERFTVTSFGESHGGALGVVVDGCPAGVAWNEGLLLSELARRRPGQSALVSGRMEEDRPELLSGVFEGRTLGTPIAILVRNRDARSEDYKEIAGNPRPGHADDVWRLKFDHSDPRGGGRSSGRETVARVMAGAVARMFLQQACPGLRLRGWAESVGPFSLSPEESKAAFLAEIDAYPARFPSARLAKEVEALLRAAKLEGRSYGGRAVVRVEGLPAGLGQPVFHKLKADFASAMMGVGATAGVEIGDGFASSEAEGTEYHGREARREESPYGGIRGGISTGGPLEVRVAFKPTSSVMDVAKQGRHDPCIVPRAVPVLESMAWLVLADHFLWARADRA
jgi:chorismate synthase